MPLASASGSASASSSSGAAACATGFGAARFGVLALAFLRVFCFFVLVVRLRLLLVRFFLVRFAAISDLQRASYCRDHPTRSGRQPLSSRIECKVRFTSYPANRLPLTPAGEILHHEPERAHRSQRSRRGDGRNRCVDSVGCSPFRLSPARPLARCKPRVIRDKTYSTRATRRCG